MCYVEYMLVHSPAKFYGPTISGSDFMEGGGTMCPLPVLPEKKKPRMNRVKIVDILLRVHWHFAQQLGA